MTYATYTWGKDDHFRTRKGIYRKLYAHTHALGIASRKNLGFHKTHFDVQTYRPPFKRGWLNYVLFLDRYLLRIGRIKLKDHTHKHPVTIKPTQEIDMGADHGPKVNGH